MAEVKTKITLLNITQDPGKLIEDIAKLSYQTQRFYEKEHPKLIKFASGRSVPYDQFGLECEPEIGKPLPGYLKDDMYVAEIIPASWERVVKFVLAVGHHSLLECCTATFLLENITRKGALHFLRYKFCAFNMQSQKYKNQGDFEYLLPGADEAPPGVRDAMKSYMATLQNMYETLRKTGIDAEWSRCPYPNNIAQTMTMSTNFRQWRHIFDCLCGDDYVPENRKIVMEMLHIFKKEVPEFFYDFILSDDREFATRKGAKYARNKKVNWTLSPADKASFGLDVPTPPRGAETEIP